MPTRRTKKHKLASQARLVNTQFKYTYSGQAGKSHGVEKANKSVIDDDLASVKKDLLRSLVIALLIVVSLTVLYLLS